MQASERQRVYPASLLHGANFFILRFSLEYFGKINKSKKNKIAPGLPGALRICKNTLKL